MGKSLTASGSRQRWNRLRLVTYSLPLLVLVLFHATLLGRRLIDGSILHPAVIGRWGFGAALLVLFTVFRRSQSCRKDHRIAIIFWLLAAILHLGVPAGEQYADAPERLAVLVEAGLAIGTTIAVLSSVEATSRHARSAGFRWMAIEPPAPRSFEQFTDHSDRAPPSLA